MDSKSTIEAVTAVAVLGNALLTWWTAHRVERANAKIAIIAEEAKKIRKIVDGPLTLAVETNKDLSARVAELTGDHGDAMAAIKAAAVAENRKDGKESVPLPPSPTDIIKP